VAHGGCADKHRFLTELSSRANVVGGYHPLLTGVPDEVRQHPTFVVEVVFRKSQLDVVNTLTDLQQHVSSLIREFEPAFSWRYVDQRDLSETASRRDGA
jgi:hypothetical protein